MGEKKPGECPNFLPCLFVMYEPMLKEIYTYIEAVDLSELMSSGVVISREIYSPIGE